MNKLFKMLKVVSIAFGDFVVGNFAIIMGILLLAILLLCGYIFYYSFFGMWDKMWDE